MAVVAVTSWNRRLSPCWRLRAGSLDRDDPEHGDRPGRGDRDRPRPRRGRRSSATASGAAAPPRSRCRRSKAAINASSRSGRSNTSAMTSVTLPRIADCGAAIRMAVVAARHARPPARAASVQRLRGSCSGGPGTPRGARPDLAQRRQHADARREQPDAGGDGRALPGDDPLRADRESEREVARVRVEERDREQIAEHQPQQRGQHAEHQRVEQQRLDGVQRVAPFARSSRTSP